MARETETKTAKLFKYCISGYYYAGSEYKRFEEIVFAESNSVAMQQVVGEYAWKESLDGNTFLLDVIHYECW